MARVAPRGIDAAPLWGARAEGASFGDSVGSHSALLPDRPLANGRHQMLIRCASPHQVGTLGIRIYALRIGVIETGVGTNDHDVRPGLDPMVGGRGLRRVWIRVACISAA